MKGAGSAVTALLLAATAQADVIIKYKTTNLGDASRESTGVLIFGPDRLATRSSTEPARTVFRGDKQLLWSIHDGDRTYAELDKREAERLAGLAKAKVASLEAKLGEGLSADKREKTEDLI